MAGVSVPTINLAIVLVNSICILFHASLFFFPGIKITEKPFTRL